MIKRRRFIGQSAAAASALAFPLIGGAQPKAVKVGILHPVTGALAFSGQQCRAGALLAVEDINRTGIRSVGGAKLDAMLGAISGVALLRLIGFASTVFGATVPWMLSLQYVAMACAIGLGLWVIRSGLVLEPPAFLAQWLTALTERITQRFATP